MSITASGPQRNSKVRLKIVFALLCAVALYAFQFFFEGGDTYVSPDGRHYLALARGEEPAAPFNHRILKPAFASLTASISGLSLENSFRVLTAAEILASLIALSALLRQVNSPPAWQAAILAALGSALGVSFGHVPVLVDPLLLLWACLMLLALERGSLVLGLLLACAGALTKEYGIFLGFAWAAYAYRRGYRRLAFAGALLPAAGYFLLMIGRPPSSGTNASFLELIRGTAAYELQILNSPQLPKVVYGWLWGVIWPVSSLATLAVFLRGPRQEKLDARQLAYAVMLAFTPFLLIGDWDRSFLILVPFACIAATAHTLSEDRAFCALLAAGGVCTALARPLYTVLQAPASFTISMSVLSVGASLAIGVKILMYTFRVRAAELNRA
jgi:hypothetical protein